MELKNKTTFIILALLLGGFGAHRAYCGKYNMLIIGIVGFLLSIIGIGFLIIYVNNVIAIIDAVRALTDEEYCKEWNLDSTKKLF